MFVPPTDAQFQLLAALLHPDPTAGYQHLLRWQAQTDFTGPLSVPEIRLIPQVWHQFQTFMYDNPLKNRFMGLYKKSAYNNTLLFGQLPTLMQALEQAGVTYAFTKGVALQVHIYDTPGARPMNDIDLLVAPNDFATAHATICALGYAPRFPQQTLETVKSGVFHAFTFDHPTRKTIDLHGYPTTFHNQRLTNNFFLNDHQRYVRRGLALPLLTPEKLFLFLLANYQPSPDWQWMVDAVRLYRRYDFSLAGVYTQAEYTGLLHLTHRKMQYLQTHFGVGQPADLAPLLRQPPTFADRYALQMRSTGDRYFRLVRVVSPLGLLAASRTRVMRGFIGSWWARFRAAPGQKLRLYARRIGQTLFRH